MKARMLRLCAATVAAFAFLAAAPRAAADQLTLTLNNAGTTVTFNPFGTTPDFNARGGPFYWSQQSPLNTNYPNTLTTYCIDLDNLVDPDSTYTFETSTNLRVAESIGAAASNTKIAAINELFDRYYNDSLTSTPKQAAFQLALWELVYDYDKSATSPGNLSKDRVQDLTLTSGDGKAAKILLDSLSKASSYTPTQDLLDKHLEVLIGQPFGFSTFSSTSPPRAQDQIVVVPNPGNVPGVPAPPAALLAGFGVLALLGRARWNRNKATAA